MTACGSRFLPAPLARPRGLLAVLMVWLAIVPLASEAVAQDPLAEESFPLDDRDPERSVPSDEQAVQSPLKMGYFVMLLLERSKGATERGDHEAAVKYYRALVKALPQRAQSHGLLCKAYEAAGDQQHALESCKAALGQGGVTIDDNLKYVELALKQPGSVPAGTAADIEAIAKHFEHEVADKKQATVLAEQVRCQLGMRLNDTKRLAACVTNLKAAAPQDGRTFAYELALRLEQRDYAAAAGTIEAAKRAGLPADATARMEQGLVAARNSQPAERPWLARWGVQLSAIAAGLVAALAVFFAARRKRLTAAAVR